MTSKLVAGIGFIKLIFIATLAAAYAQTAAPPSAPPPLLPFDDALLKAAETLLSKAILPPGEEKLDLVIDPLIDGISGAQSAATHLMEKRLVEFIQSKYPRFRILPFTKELLAKSPIVLVGTLRAINNAGVQTAPKDAYWICLRLADLRTKKIVANGGARAKPEGVDVTPTLAYADNPVWANDPATTAYIKTCQETKAGDPLSPAYVESISAAALISDAIAEYDVKHYRVALAFYRTALGEPGGGQLRVYNGVYLANWRMNRLSDAAESFGSLVDFSLKANKLAVRFLFKPGSTLFLDDRAITGPYSMWLKEIANCVDQENLCLEVVGHTSPTGPAQVNERLSVLRAQRIKELLETSQPRLGERLVATGVGSRENLIGTAKDDASDALDRRVEFKVLKCG